ncbi:MAG: hypothetical protein MJA29_00685 [Candidatus Omnitrophica bacterium]|nr:hypothetical protein [Candidatus Omnitrophota bacterium]
MRKHELYSEFSDTFEYLGRTEIMRIRRKGTQTIRRDWIIFETTHEALSHFEDKCGEYLGYYE